VKTKRQFICQEQKKRFIDGN